MTSHEVTFLRPKIYFIQYLLIPVRVLMFIPLLGSLMIFVLVCKTYLAIIGLIAVGILLGCGWLIDTYVWQGFSRSFIAVLLAILLMYPTWLGVAWLLGSVIERIGTLTGLSKDAEPIRVKVGDYWERMVDFVFEAKYKQPFIDLYGSDFPQPKFSEFGLEAEEYYAYNRRFSLDGFEFPLAVFSGFIAGWVTYYFEPSASRHFLIGIVTAVLTYLALFNFERWLARRKPQHFKVHNYQRALKIYESIQSDIRNAKIKAAHSNRGQPNNSFNPTPR